MKKFAINGRFVVRKQTGQERFARELINELDGISKRGEFTLVVPKYATDIPNLQNIEVIRYGNLKSHIWEQIDFLYYIKKHNLISVNLTTKCPLFSPDIVCLHDACIFEMRKLLTHNLYGKMSYIWHYLIFKVAALKAKKILTVSCYSKKRLMHYLKIPSDKIAIIWAFAFILQFAVWKRISRKRANLVFAIICGVLALAFLALYVLELTGILP